MQIYDKKSGASEVHELMDAVRRNPRGWKALNVAVRKGDGKAVTNAVGKIAGCMQEVFSDKEGGVFICGKDRILAVGHLGNDNARLRALKERIDDRFPGYSCSVDVVPGGKTGIEVIVVRLKEEWQGGPSSRSGRALLRERTRRALGQRVFFVVDDDMYTRYMMKQILAPCGPVREFADGTGVAAAYMEQNPDAVFLDVHLPCGSGMEVLDAIMSHDHTAGVAILSIDRSTQNVLQARARGIRHFIAKPFTKGRVENVLRKTLEYAALLDSMY